MHKNIRLLFIILLVFAIASTATLFFTQHHAVVNQRNRPASFFKQLDYRKYNNDGSLHLSFTTSKMYHFLQGNSSHIVKPNILLLDANQVPWHIKAESAHSWHGQQVIILQHNVVFYHPRHKSNPETTIKTSQAYLYPQSNYASSKQNVMLKRPGVIMYGKGLRANLKHGLITLVKQTHGSFHQHK
jgi:LPS export ABC transporter protein LptC